MNAAFIKPFQNLLIISEETKPNVNPH